MTLLKFLTLALFLVSISCDTTEPPPVHVPTVQLTLDEAGVTEVWLRLKFTDSEIPRGFAVQRGGLIVLTGILSSQDTIVVDTSAMPKHNYVYAALRMDGAARADSSADLNVTTLDTTSSRYTFFVDTLGIGSSSILNDVSVFSASDVWAVGEIFGADSTGQLDPTAYSAAHWDGSEWTLHRFYYTYNSNTFLIVPMRGIQGFAANDTWFAAGSVFSWNGTNITSYLLRSTILSGEETVEKLWGLSSRSLWGVGNYGVIVRFDGANWSKLTSNTTLPINDIWGGVDQRSAEQVILAVASNTGVNQGMKLLRIQGASISELATDGLAWKLSSLWFKLNRRYYVVGDGLYEKRSLSSSGGWKDNAPGLTQYYMRRVRGSGLNDIVVVGDFGNFLHYNGVAWRNLHNQTSMQGVFTSVDAKDNFVVAVGFVGNRAIALRGYRQP